MRAGGAARLREARYLAACQTPQCYSNAFKDL
jgi:hypothetical protein